MRNRTLVLLGLLSPVLASHAGAAVPSPATSTVQACMVLCPMGDISFSVTVRDFANNPVAGSTVVLDFGTCVGAYLCPFSTNDPYILDLPTRTLRMTSGANGTVTFPARVGGGCGAERVRIYADGVLLASRILASPDQNGDGVVTTPDGVILMAKIGGGDLSGDLDCSGTVTDDDVLVQGQHGSHSCYGIVNPVQPRTWGALKLHYR